MDSIEVNSSSGKVTVESLERGKFDRIEETIEMEGCLSIANVPESWVAKLEPKRLGINARPVKI